MPKLILIKHAAPLIVPGVPPEKWSLSDAGRHASTALATALTPLKPAIVISSLEPKAAETGAIVAARLGVPLETARDLHEHDRSNVPHLPSREFISLVELFFRRPTELVLGRETADAALLRFEQAVENVIKAQGERDVAIVSHGTVIALLLERHGDGHGFELWRKMGLPSYAVLNRADWQVEQIVDRI